MKKFLKPLVGVVAMATATVGVAGHAQAQPIAKFTMSVASPYVGQLVTFNGSGSTCDVGRTCTYTWSWTFRTSGGATLTGGQMGTGKIISYRFSSYAASKPYITVKLKVTASGPTNNFGLATKSFIVRNSA